MKVVFFGDSLTWGGYGGNYVGAIRKRVGDRHEIINAGQGGNTVVNLWRRYEADVCVHEPDKVFIMVGGNDAVSASQPGTRPYYRKSMQLEDGYVPLELFEQTYRNLIGALQAEYIEVAVGLEPIETNATVVAELRRYNEAARAAARAYNIPVLDLFAEFVPDDIPDRKNVDTRFIQQIGDRERTGWNDWENEQKEHGYSFTFDGVHWTPDTAEHAADKIIEFLELA